MGQEEGAWPGEAVREKCFEGNQRSQRGTGCLGGKEPPMQSLLRLFACTSGRRRLISILFSRLSRGCRTLKPSEGLLLPSHQHPKCQVPGKVGLENGGSRQCDCSCPSFSLGVDTDGGKT